MLSHEFKTMYRGVVISNSGTGSEGGRCKIFVPGIYPNQYKDNANALPWAEPIVPLFGGNYSGSGVKTGVCGWPSVGAHVWVFFEQGDHMLPIYFGATQGVAGWAAESNLQWVVQTDRVKLTIDEEDDNDRISLIATGNVNIEIDGDVTQSITGDVNETIGGDVTRIITGNLNETIGGDVTKTIAGSCTTNISGTHTYTVPTTNITGNVNITGTVTITGPLTVVGASTFTGVMGVTGVITNVGGISIDGIPFGTHVHGDVDPGVGTSGGPQ